MTGDITLDQEHFITDLEAPPLKHQDADMKLSQDPDLVTDYRSGIGSLQWVAGMTRPDVAAHVSLLQDSFEKLLACHGAANITIRRLDPDTMIIAS